MKFKPSKKIPNRGKLILESKEEIMFFAELMGEMTTNKCNGAGLNDDQQTATYKALSHCIGDEIPNYRVKLNLTSKAELVSVEL